MHKPAASELKDAPFPKGSADELPLAFKHKTTKWFTRGGKDEASHSSEKCQIELKEEEEEEETSTKTRLVASLNI